MCGRITLTTPDIEEVASLLEATVSPADAALYKPRYNAAPTDTHWIAQASPSGRVLVPAVWGFPGGMINARSETADKRFRSASRVIVAADGTTQLALASLLRKSRFSHAKKPPRSPFARWSSATAESARRFLTSSGVSLVENVAVALRPVFLSSAVTLRIDSPDSEKTMSNACDPRGPFGRPAMTSVPRYSLSWAFSLSP